jgi:hypothetical protein
MSEKLTALQVNAQTGQVVEIELSSEEIAERKELAIQDAQSLIESEAKIAARQSALAKLAALGLTEEEIAAL